jgi:outer membrane protein assembly factor BamB
LYVVFADQIRNFNFDTGELIWQNDTQQWSLQNGILDDNMLYLERRKDGVAAYNLTKQHLEWERDDLFLTDYPPTKYKDTLFIGSRDSVPVAIEALTGRTLWEAVELSEDNYQTPLIFDDTVYIRGLFQKKIYALNPDNGNLIGFIKLGIPDIGFSTNASYSLGPVQAGEIIIFPAGNRLLAYER